MDVAGILEEGRRMVEAEMEKTMPRGRKPKEVYGIAWDFLDRGGKRLRPALCLLCAWAVGGRKEDALPAATCIELFHNFTLIHDDIEDDSKMRRGKPCLHVLYGLPLAINAGDGLFMMAWKAALGMKLPEKKQLYVQGRLHEVFTKVLEGQAVELQWHKEKTWGMGEEEYLNMVRGKTGALIAGSCEAGAICGGAGEKEAKALYEFGMLIGTAFQIQDDVLNIVGDEKEYRKEIWGDITEGKRTLMVLHALLRAGKEEKKFLEEVLDSHTRDRKRLGKAARILEKHGSVDYAKRAAFQMVGEARKKLEALPKSEAKDALWEIAGFLVERKV